ncbi:matrilin-2-like [Photinus pyralis]|uniref:matrilin-2-like n=1 Tax=Photinus pyralis TaxID=7054 RepID=UPI0012677D49|nr:matrilin-2-like [Photinus pyralis]
MSRIFLLCLAVCLVQIVLGKKCGENEEWMERIDCEAFCGGSKDMTDRCDAYISTWGCKCKNGFVRNHNNKRCMRENRCPRTNAPRKVECGENEEWTEVIGCEAFCGGNYGCYISICADIPTWGCKCKDGFVRNHANQRCIMQDKCPPKK